ILFIMSCSQNKITFIDVALLMKEYEGLKAFDKEVKDEQDKLRKEIESLIEPYQAKVDAYYKNVGEMSASTKTETEQALQQEQTALEAQQEKFKQQLEKQRLDGLETINKEIAEFVENYAKSKGFQLVLTTSGTETVIYGDDKLDITQEVLTELNRLYNEKK
ncbi:MAG: OmpH family outer membrane protein, partial [Cyclobacteriaceae bacterium]|nr:OmpH family outer membrane protein [Cyclobacteriaceae bacterium]